jgi:hypothetical protein
MNESHNQNNNEVQRFDDTESEGHGDSYLHLTMGMRFGRTFTKYGSIGLNLGLPWFKSTLEYSEKTLLPAKTTWWQWLVRGKYCIPESVESSVQERLAGIDSDDPLPVESAIEGIQLIDDPTNHDRIAMYYVYKCRLALPDITLRTEANRIRAAKWICAELSSKEGLRLKHLDRIRVKFLRLLFIQHEADIEDAIEGASRGLRDREMMPDYTHVVRGWFGLLRPRGRASSFQKA